MWHGVNSLLGVDDSDNLAGCDHYRFYASMVEGRAGQNWETDRLPAKSAKMKPKMRVNTVMRVNGFKKWF